MQKAAMILEGGANRGIFTSGVLDYLMEQEFYTQYVLGVSMGACNGVDYVSRQIGRTKECVIRQNKKEEDTQTAPLCLRTITRRRTVI